jgi:hypothetical protein
MRKAAVLQPWVPLARRILSERVTEFLPDNIPLDFFPNAAVYS